MQDVISERLRACKVQLDQTEQAYLQGQQRQNQLGEEIVGLRRAVQELETLAQQVIVALPDGAGV